MSTKISLTNRASFPLLSLPSEAIDLIVCHLLPKPTFNPRISSHFVTDVLPLALTSRTIFKKVSVHLASSFYFIYDNTKLAVFPNVQDLLNHPQYQLILYQAAVIALNLLRKQLLMSKNSKKSRARKKNIMLQLCSQFNLRLTNFIPDKFEDLKEITECDSNAPLLDKQKHTVKCRHMMSWLAIAASSGKLNQLYFTKYNIGDERLHHCVLRFYQNFKLRPDDVKFPPVIFTSILKQGLSNISASIKTVDISPIDQKQVNAMCSVHFPKLENIIFSNSHTTEPENYSGIRDGFIKLLEQLQQKGTRLKKLSIDILWFHITENSEKFMDLNTLAPTIRDLVIKMKGLAPGKINFKTFKGCDNIESLEILETPITLKVVQALREDGYLPNLKSIECDTLGMENAKSDMDPVTYNLSAPLVKIIRGMGFPGDSMILILQTHFLSATEIGFATATFPNGISSYISSATKLESIALSVVGGFVGLLPAKFYYNHEFIQAITPISPRLDRVEIDGIIAHVDAGIEMLCQMGLEATEFCFALCDEIPNEGYVSEISLSLDNFLRVLDTVEKYCPKMKYLRVLKKESTIGWTDAERYIAKCCIMRTSWKLKHFDCIQLYMDWDLDHLERKIMHETEAEI